MRCIGARCDWDGCSDCVKENWTELRGDRSSSWPACFGPRAAVPFRIGTNCPSFFPSATFRLYCLLKTYLDLSVDCGVERASDQEPERQANESGKDTSHYWGSPKDLKLNEHFIGEQATADFITGAPGGILRMQPPLCPPPPLLRRETPPLH